MKNRQVPSAFGRQCISILEGFKKRLVQESSEYTLKSYCEELDIDYRRVIEWSTRHGYYVRAIKSEVYGPDLVDTAGLCETFVQFRPEPSPRTEGCPLRGVSIVFQDGVSLRLEESDCESVIALLETYARRRTAREAGCSR